MKRLLIFLLAAVLALSALSGCGGENNSPTDSRATADESAEATEPKSNPKAYPDYEEFGLDNAFVKMPAAAAEGFREYLDGIETVYKDSAWFFTENALNSYASVDKELPSGEGKIIKDGKLDEERFYKTLEKNREMFFENGSSGRYLRLSDEDNERAAATVCDQLEKMLSECGFINTEYLDYKLSGLVLTGYKVGYGTAGVETDKPLLWVSMTTIKDQQKRNTDVDVFDNVVRHQTARLVQTVYNSDPNVRTHVGPGLVFRNSEVDSLDWTWYTEGAAERLSENDYGDKHIYYSDNVRAIESLAVAKIADESYAPNAPESLSLQGELEPIFDYFHADTDEKKTEVLDLMFTQEIYFNNSPSYVEYYKINVGRMTLSEKDELSESHKRSIAETLTKLFYRDLADSLEKHEGRLEDVYHLIRVWETELNRLTDYDNQVKAEYNRDMIKRYKEIQNEFFAALSEGSSLDAETLRQAYCAYSDGYRAEMRNRKYDGEPEPTDVRMVSKEKRMFIAYLEKDRASRINTNINR